MRPRGRALVGLLIATAALLWWLGLSHSSAPSPAPLPAAASEPAAAPEPVPPPRQAEKPAAPVAAAAQPSPTVAAPTPSAPVIHPPDTRGFVDALQQRFEADAIERGAGGAETALRRLVRDAGAPASMLRSVACRRTLCKLELRWTVADDAAYHKLVERLMGDNAKFFATRAQPPEVDGSMRVDAYWVRR